MLLSFYLSFQICFWVCEMYISPGPVPIDSVEGERELEALKVRVDIVNITQKTTRIYIYDISWNIYIVYLITTDITDIGGLQ